MRVLVSAASRHGTTAEIADAIADVLRKADIEVDVLAPESVETVDPYDAVVLGSGVYAGHWLAPAKAFVERHEEGLRYRAVFLFSSGPLGDPPKPVEEPVDVAAIDVTTAAMDHRVFAGRLTESELSRPERIVIKVVRAPFGDFREWDDITQWASEIARFVKDEEGALTGVPG
jgi:menaquinone-dependent protoporphyrinogen oxidase